MNFMSQCDAELAFYWHYYAEDENDDDAGALNTAVPGTGPRFDENDDAAGQHFGAALGP